MMIPAIPPESLRYKLLRLFHIPQMQREPTKAGTVVGVRLINACSQNLQKSSNYDLLVVCIEDSNIVS